MEKEEHETKTILKFTQILFIKLGGLLSYLSIFIIKINKIHIMILKCRLVFLFYLFLDLNLHFLHFAHCTLTPNKIKNMTLMLKKTVLKMRLAVFLKYRLRLNNILNEYSDRAEAFPFGE